MFLAFGLRIRLSLVPKFKVGASGDPVGYMSRHLCTAWCEFHRSIALYELDLGTVLKKPCALSWRRVQFLTVA